MKLLELQRQMAKSILQPLTSTDRIAPRTDSRFIKPNARLNSAERLEIYSRSYWFRVLDSLYDDFPGLRAIHGQRAFHRLSRAYLTDCPSQSFTLRNLGSRLEQWLKNNPEYAGSNPVLTLDMVRLEWAHIEAFDNAIEKVLGPEDLSELLPQSRLRLQPHVRLLALDYPVDDLRIQVNQTTDEHAATSNTFLKHKHRSLSRRLRGIKPELVFLAVHRVDFTVFYRRLEAGEHCLLSALGAGKSIGSAIGSALTMDGRHASQIEQWFATWAQLGWLCPVSRKNKVSR
jgi:hypothetical protein